MTDMIRKSDALAHCYDNISFAAIAALPAVTVGVKPLAFEGRNGFWRADDGIGGFYEVTEVYSAFHMCRVVVGVANKLIPYNSKDAAFSAANVEHQRRILAALEPAAPPKTWPEGFFHLTSDTLHLRCATEGCGQRVRARMEVEGIGSDYCEPCILKIIALTPKPVDASQATDPVVNAPDPAAIREALRIVQSHADYVRDEGAFDAGWNAAVQSIETEILALIAKGAAE